MDSAYTCILLTLLMLSIVGVLGHCIEQSGKWIAERPVVRPAHATEEMAA